MRDDNRPRYLIAPGLESDEINFVWVLDRTTGRQSIRHPADVRHSYPDSDDATPAEIARWNIPPGRQERTPRLPEPDEPAPTVDIRDGHLACPVCGELNRIIEQDQAIRNNALTLTDDGNIVGGHGDTHFEHKLFFCDACRYIVDIPDRMRRGITYPDSGIAPQALPMDVDLEHGNLTCPHCSTLNRIVEIDRCERRNDVRAREKHVIVSLQPADFEHVRYECDACGHTVAMPQCIDVVGNPAPLIVPHQENPVITLRTDLPVFDLVIDRAAIVDDRSYEYAAFWQSRRIEPGTYVLRFVTLQYSEPFSHDGPDKTWGRPYYVVGEIPSTVVAGHHDLQKPGTQVTHHVCIYDYQAKDGMAFRGRWADESAHTSKHPIGHLHERRPTPVSAP